MYLAHGLALLRGVVIELARTGADRWGRRWRGNGGGNGPGEQMLRVGRGTGRAGEDLLVLRSKGTTRDAPVSSFTSAVPLGAVLPLDRRVAIERSLPHRLAGVLERDRVTRDTVFLKLAVEVFDLHGVRDGVPATLAARVLRGDLDVRLGAAHGREEVKVFGGGFVDGSDGHRRGLQYLTARFNCKDRGDRECDSLSEWSLHTRRRSSSGSMRGAVGGVEPS